jgi:hypothetical protein
MSGLGHASRRLGYRAATGGCRFKPRFCCDFDFGDSVMWGVASCRAVSQVWSVEVDSWVAEAPDHVRNRDLSLRCLCARGDLASSCVVYS